jgi:hypothetical protein
MLVNFLKQTELEKVRAPGVRRFPIRIDLPEFADFLAGRQAGTRSLSTESVEGRSVLAYITYRIVQIAEATIRLEDMRGWLASYPWLLVFDGLDEVPASGNRETVIAAINRFWEEVATQNADVLVIVTTRPQGYNNDFLPELYQHIWLTRLSQAQALHYANRLIDAQAVEMTRKRRVLTRLENALREPATARLLVAPLQVTIMLALLDGKGEAPQDRWSLFSGFYTVVRDRELAKHSAVAEVLRTNSVDVDAIQQQAGFILQIESEAAGGAESYFTPARLTRLVEIRLASQGYKGSQLSQLTADILKTATHRLGFLVGEAEGKIASFEK